MELSTLSPGLDRHKSEMENELLIKLGVKKEEVRSDLFMYILFTILRKGHCYILL